MVETCNKHRITVKNVERRDVFGGIYRWKDNIKIKLKTWGGNV